MIRADSAGNPVSGATPTALTAYDHALAEFQIWGDPAPHVTRMLAEAPHYAMGHILKAYLRVCGRDPRRIQNARTIHAQVSALPLNARERLHLRAIAAVIDGDYERAVASLDALLATHPRDALALQAAQSFDYLVGATQRMLDRVERVTPKWQTGAPGCEAVLAMNAFALEECGYYERAEECALSVLEMDPLYVPAYHVMAHVFEMTDRADAGARWMAERLLATGVSTKFTTHCWWHLALFHLSAGRADAALQMYDQRIWAHDANISDLIDASALLWRIGLGGADAEGRWQPLADAWSTYIDDAFCSFSDLHAMLAFVGARDWERLARLEAVLTASGERKTRHGSTSLRLGLPALQALEAYGQGDNASAAALLSQLPPRAHHFGGSHAQRDILTTTLISAVQQLRRPAPRTFQRRPTSSRL